MIESVITGVLVVLAALYLSRGLVRFFKGGASCGCGCSKTKLSLRKDPGRRDRGLSS